MPHAITRSLLKRLALLLPAAILLWVAGRELNQKFNKTKQAPYTVGIIYNSHNLAEEDMAVVKLVIDRRLKEINQKGGLAGKNLEAIYLDDKGHRDTVNKVISESLKNENLIGYVGCWGSSRVQAVTDLVGKAGVPFIGGYSVTSIARNYPNIFSFETSLNQMNEVIRNLLQTREMKIAFVGNTGDLYSEALLQQLNEMGKQPGGPLVRFEKWYANDHRFTPEALQLLTDSLKASGVGFLILSTNRHHTNQILGAFKPNNLQIPVFTAFIDLQELDLGPEGGKEVEIYDINVFGIPSALNLRQQQQKKRFAGALKTSNRIDFQVALGGLFADAIGLLEEAYRARPADPNIPIRLRISKGLQEYINGRQVFRGWFSDWRFTSERSLVNETLLGWKPAGSQKPILAPIQFIHHDSALQRAQVFYTRLDLVDIDQVSDEQATFNARFFLSINSQEPITIDQIDFANAVRNHINHKPLLHIKLLRGDSVVGKKSYFRNLYRISGQFLYKPDLKKYPFDAQEFTITLQTNNAYRPFLIQPSEEHYRDTLFNAPGWNYQHHFIGYEQELIASSNTFIRQPRHLVGYKFNFTYELKRARVDFYLKVITPLLAILIITYFSIFIPIREFEAVTAIQVTALLSSIALYFSAYKPAGQFATISDKIFILAYVMITTLIGTSVLELYLYKKRREHRRLSLLINIYEWFLFPVILVVFTFFIIR